MSKKLKYEDVKNYIESYGYQLVSKEYKDSHNKLKVQCPKGHIYEVSFYNFKIGRRCPYCAKNANEKIVKELKDGKD